METVKLDLEERKETGKEFARRTRAAGSIPGVVYRGGQPATPVLIRHAAMKRALAGGTNVVFELSFAGAGAANRYAVLKELQMNPTRYVIQHVDLLEIDLSQEIDASVPVELIGEPAGLKEGGMVEFMHREISVKARPDRVPETFQLDVSNLGIGDHIAVSAVGEIDGVQIVDDLDTIVATVLAPRVMEEEEAAAGEEFAPELVGEEVEAEPTTEEK